METLLKERLFQRYTGIKSSLASRRKRYEINMNMRRRIAGAFCSEVFPYYLNCNYFVERLLFRP